MNGSGATLTFPFNGDFDAHYLCMIALNLDVAWVLIYLLSIVFTDDSCTAKALKALLGKGCLFTSQMKTLYCKVPRWRSQSNKERIAKRLPGLLMYDF